MKELFKDYGINLNDENEKKLGLFYDFLTEYNKKVNLTSITEEKEVWIKHFLDSVIGEKFFEKNSSVIEIGSGGGFPSIPLKIIRSDLSFTLCDSTGKKCEYLKEAVKYLGLENVEVVCARAEDLGKNPVFREKFDVVTARAVARLNTLSEYCLPLCKVGGKFVAYKGEASEEIKEAVNAVEILGGKISAVEKTELPFGSGERNIVVIDKIKKTPPSYPRGNGKERKKPL